MEAISAAVEIGGTGGAACGGALEQADQHRAQCGGGEDAAARGCRR